MLFASLGNSEWFGIVSIILVIWANLDDIHYSNNSELLMIIVGREGNLGPFGQFWVAKAYIGCQGHSGEVKQ